MATVWMSEAAVCPMQLTVEVETAHGRIWCLLTSCVSFEEFRDLPSVIEFQSKHYNRISWNSDKGKACYKWDDGIHRTATLVA